MQEIRKCKCGGLPICITRKGVKRDVYSIRCAWCKKSTDLYLIKELALKEWDILYKEDAEKALVIEGVNRFRGFEAVKNAPSDTILPVRATDGSAGYDFFAPDTLVIQPHSFSELIPLNIKAYMQVGEVLLLFIRSSLATTKGGLMVSQGVAVIDKDYYGNPKNDGNIGVRLYNRDDKVAYIKKGDRIVQGIFMPFLIADNDTVLGKRTGGYGSTGK